MNIRTVSISVALIVLSMVGQGKLLAQDLIIEFNEKGQMTSIPPDIMDIGCGDSLEFRVNASQEYLSQRVNTVLNEYLNALETINKQDTITFPYIPVDLLKNQYYKQINALLTGELNVLITDPHLQRNRLNMACKRCNGTSSAIKRYEIDLLGPLGDDYVEVYLIVDGKKPKSPLVSLTTDPNTNKLVFHAGDLGFDPNDGDKIILSDSCDRESARSFITDVKVADLSALQLVPDINSLIVPQYVVDWEVYDKEGVRISCWETLCSENAVECFEESVLLNPIKDCCSGKIHKRSFSGKIALEGADIGDIRYHLRQKNNYYQQLDDLMAKNPWNFDNLDALTKSKAFFNMDSVVALYDTISARLNRCSKQLKTYDYLKKYFTLMVSCDTLEKKDEASLNTPQSDAVDRYNRELPFMVGDEYLLLQNEDQFKNADKVLQVAPIPYMEIDKLKLALDKTYQDNHQLFNEFFETNKVPFGNRKINRDNEQKVFKLVKDKLFSLELEITGILKSTNVDQLNKVFYVKALLQDSVHQIIDRFMADNAAWLASTYWAGVNKPVLNPLGYKSVPYKSKYNLKDLNKEKTEYAQQLEHAQNRFTYFKELAVKYAEGDTKGCCPGVKCSSEDCMKYVMGEYDKIVKEISDLQTKLNEVQDKIDQATTSQSESSKISAAPNLTSSALTELYLYKGTFALSRVIGKCRQCNLDNQPGLTFMQHHNALFGYALMSPFYTTEISEKQSMRILVHNVKPGKKLGIAFESFDLTGADETYISEELSFSKEKSLLDFANFAIEEDHKKAGTSPASMSESMQIDLYRNFAALYELLGKQMKILDYGIPKPLKNVTRTANPNYETREFTDVETARFRKPTGVKYTLTDTISKDSVVTIGEYKYRHNKLYRFRFKVGIAYSFLKAKDYTITNNVATLKKNKFNADAIIGMQIFFKKQDIRSKAFCPRHFAFLGFLVNETVFENYFIGYGLEPINGLAITGGMHIGKSEKLVLDGGQLQAETVWRPNAFVSIIMDYTLFTTIFNIPTDLAFRKFK